MKPIKLDTKDVIGDTAVIIVKINEQICRKNYTESRKATVIDQIQKLRQRLLIKPRSLKIKKNMSPFFNKLNARGQSKKRGSEELILHVRYFNSNKRGKLG